MQFGANCTAVIASLAAFKSGFCCNNNNNKSPLAKIRAAVMTPDEFVPDPRVCQEFNVSSMTIWRWDRDPAKALLGWPPPIRINRRKFRSRKQLEQFKANLLQAALEARERKGTLGSAVVAKD